MARTKYVKLPRNLRKPKSSRSQQKVMAKRLNMSLREYKKGWKVKRGD